MTYAKKTLSEIKLIHGNYGNFIKGQKLDKKKEKKYKTPPYQHLTASNEIDGEPIDEAKKKGKAKKCWPGYEKKGTKIMFGKRYNNCVKKEEFSDWRSELGQIDEKAVSKQQQKFFGMVRATQKGEMNNPSDEVQKAADSMTKKDVKKYASTKHSKLPDKIEEKLDSEDKPFVKKLVGKLRKGSKTHAKQADDLEKAMKENTAIESELVIQDWNSDDIKFTEIETVDIIKAKPLKKNINLDEGIKKEIAKKLAKKLAKQFKKAKNVKGPFDVTGKEAMKMKRTGSSKLDFPVDKVTSQNIQTKSIINQAKKANELAAKKLTNIKSSSGKDLSKPIKVNLQKKIDFDKYIGTTPNKIQKKFGSTKPTGTFTDDLPPVKTVPLKKSQTDLMKKLGKPKKKITKKKLKQQQQQQQAQKGKEKPKTDKPLQDHYDWRKDLGEDWQKVNRKDKTDGLSRKAVKAYRRENPGSKLQTAVTTKPSKLKKGSKSAKRRLSFCRRMKGMKKKLTSAKTRRDPDSRINKALRRWNCSYEPTGTMISENLDENKLTRYMAKKVAKQVMGASNKLFSGKKSQGAKFLKKSPEGQNIRQKVANALRGNKGIGTTHAQTKNLPQTRRMSEFELSKVDKQMNQSAGRFIPGVKSGENFQAYKSPNEFYKTDMRATVKKAGGKDMLKQYDDLSKKSTADRFVDAVSSGASDIKPSDAANALKKQTLSKGLMKKVEKSGIEPVIHNKQTLDRHLRMRNMSKKNIRKANEYRDQKNLVRAIFGGKRSKRIGPTKQHRLRAQDTAIMTRSKANSDTGYLDILGGNPESMTNTLGKRSYASIQKGKIPQPKGSKKTKTPNWVKSLNRYDDDFEFGKVDVRK